MRQANPRRIDPNPLPRAPLPYNPEAERAVLGGLLIDPDQAARFLELLTPDDFHEPRHEAVLRGMQAIYQRHGQVSPVLLDEELKRQGQLADVGQTFIHDLASTCESSILTTHYVRIVTENWASRQQLYVGNDLMLGKMTGSEAAERLQAIDDRLAGLGAALDGTAGGAFSLRELMGEQLPPMRWVVPDLLPEGLALLGAKQKIGKSWMAYALSIAVASGGALLGKQIEQGEVLHLALEDGKQRLQKRGRKLLGSAPVPDGVTFELRWPPLERGGLRQLDRYLKQHPTTRLVVVDTLARVRLPRANHADTYHEDYNILASLKQVADAHHVLILLLHHTRKAAADDVYDELLGSVGISAACDTLLILARARGAADATLHITGRDIEGEGQYALRFDKATGAWQMLGDAKQHAPSEVRQEIRAAIEREGHPLSPKETALAMGQGDRYNTIKNLMRAMAKAGELQVSGGGKYSLPEPSQTPASSPKQAATPEQRMDQHAVTGLRSLHSLDSHQPRPRQVRRQTTARADHSLPVVSDSLKSIQAQDTSGANLSSDDERDYARPGTPTPHSLTPAQAGSGTAAPQTMQTRQTRQRTTLWDVAEGAEHVHEYAVMRDAHGHRLCIHCQQVEPAGEPEHDDSGEGARGSGPPAHDEKGGAA